MLHIIYVIVRNWEMRKWRLKLTIDTKENELLELKQ